MLVEKSYYRTVFLWISFFLVYAVGQEKCATPVDLMFIVDGSSSIFQENFVSVKEYIKHFVDMFDQFGPDATQVAMIQYSSSQKLKEEFHLNQYRKREDVKIAIDAVKQLHGFTYTGEALRYMVEVALTPYYGSRLGLPGVLTAAIIITDGASHDSEAVIQWQAEAKDRGVEMFAIGVGNFVNTTELLAIASEPKMKHKFLVNDFAALEQAHDLITANDICGKQIPLTTTEEIPQAVEGLCDTPQDIMFILDGSTTVGNVNFEFAKEYVKTFIRKFISFGSEATQVGVIQYSNKESVTEEIRLNQYSSLEDIERAVDNISILWGDTYTGEALKYLMEVALTPSHGSRLGKASVHTVAIVITDGKAHDHRTVVEYQAVAKSQGVEMFAIGIGSKPKEAELLDIASDPKSEHKFNVDDYAALDQLHVQLTANYICGEAVTPTVTTEELPQANEILCKTPQDMMFILDGSTSVGVRNFRFVKEYVKTFIGMFASFGPDATQVGVIQYSNKSAIREEISLNQYDNREDIERAMDDINYLSGVTYTGEALKYMMEEALTPSHGSRLDNSAVHTVAIIITDGESHDHRTVIEWQAVAKAQGVELFAIGVGTKLREDELLAIASEPKINHKFNVGDYAALEEVHKLLIANDICGEL